MSQGTGEKLHGQNYFALNINKMKGQTFYLRRGKLGFPNLPSLIAVES